MNYYKLIVSYDGTDYFGWQAQAHGITLQNAMERAFLHAFKVPCQLLAASRTDAGVHALGQVVSLRSKLSLAPAILQKVFNTSLPAAIKVVQLEATTESYNPHVGVHQKTYAYRIFTTKPLPMFARFGWQPAMPERTDWHKFAATLPAFVGTHDFTAFTRIEPGEEKQLLRSVSSINPEWITPTELVVTITGHSFLRYQIRRMLGAAFEIARKRQFDAQILQHSLATGKQLPPQLAYNAPACGLCLMSIRYD